MDILRPIFALAPRRSGLLGCPLAELQSSGFFRWFSLVEAGTRTDRIVFRPDGEAFRDSVTLDVLPDRRQCAASLTLRLDPAMLVGRNRPFGIDCIKSFLAAVIPDGDRAHPLRPVVSAMEGAMLAGPDRMPTDLHDKGPRAALAVLMGQAQTWAMREAGLDLVMRRIGVGAAPDGLEIRVARQR